MNCHKAQNVNRTSYEDKKKRTRAKSLKVRCLKTSKYYILFTLVASSLNQRSCERVCARARIARYHRVRLTIGLITLKDLKKGSRKGEEVK